MPVTIPVGVNIHTRPTGNTDLYARVPIEDQLNFIKQIGGNSIRVDVGPSSTTVETPSQIQRLVATMKAAKAQGITVQIVFTLPYGGSRADSKTDGGAFPDTTVGRYRQGYSIVSDTLLALPYAPVAIEIENEVCIKSLMLWQAGQTLVEYNTPAFEAWADLMRGEFDACKRVMPTVPVIVGVTNRNYAFIPWIISRGIQPNMVGYHLYERTGADLLTWQGGGSWHAAMQAYGLPITVNEANGHQDEPVAGAVIGLAGAKTFNDILASPAPVQSLYIYELFEIDGLRHGIAKATREEVAPTVFKWVFERSAHFKPLLNAMAQRADGSI